MSDAPVTPCSKTMWPAIPRLLRGLIVLAAGAWLVVDASGWPNPDYDARVFVSTFSFAAFFLAGTLIVRGFGAWISVKNGKVSVFRWFTPRLSLDLPSLSGHSQDGHWLYLRAGQDIHQVELSGFSQLQAQRFQAALTANGVPEEPQRIFGRAAGQMGVMRLVAAFGGAFVAMLAWLSWFAPDLVIGGSRIGALSMVLLGLLMSSFWLWEEVNYRRWRLVVLSGAVVERNWRNATTRIDLGAVRDLIYVAPLRGFDSIQFTLEDGSNAMVPAGLTSHAGRVREAIETEVGRSMDVRGALAWLVKRPPMYGSIRYSLSPAEKVGVLIPLAGLSYLVALSISVLDLGAAILWAVPTALLAVICYHGRAFVELTPDGISWSDGKFPSQKRSVEWGQLAGVQPVRSRIWYRRGMELSVAGNDAVTVYFPPLARSRVDEGLARVRDNLGRSQT